MGIKQQKVGKEWEQQVVDYYSAKGWFAYKFPTDFNGTVCDIVICKSAACMFIECKHITGDKLYYLSSGIKKKRDELDRFVSITNNNIYIMIKSDKKGYFWTTWLKAKPVFEEKGYLDVEKDCFRSTL